MSSYTDIILERFVAGDLPGPKISEIEAALAGDPTLAARIAVLRSSTEAFLAERPPDQFARRLAGRIDHEGKATSGLSEFFRSWSPAFALFCAVIGIFWTTFEQPGSDPFEISPQLDGVSRLASPIGERTELKEISPVQEPKVGARGAAPQAMSARSVTKQVPLKPRRKAKKAYAQKPADPKREIATPIELAAAPVPPAPEPAFSQLKPSLSARGTRAGAPVRKGSRLMMAAPAPQSFELKVRSPSEGTRRLIGDTMITTTDEILAAPKWRGPLHWGYLITKSGAQDRLVDELSSRPYTQDAVLSQPVGFSGEATIWVLACLTPFSIENILFDGMSLRSENDNCKVFKFSALF
jgi:hypothetical protein